MKRWHPVIFRKVTIVLPIDHVDMIDILLFSEVLHTKFHPIINISMNR